MKQKEKKWTYVNSVHYSSPGLFDGDLSDTAWQDAWLSICDKETGEYTAEYFMAFFKDGYYIGVLSGTLILSRGQSCFVLLWDIRLPISVAHMKGWKRSIATTFLVLPLWVSITIRMFGWMAILPKSGVFSIILQALHLFPNHRTFWEVMLLP